MTPEQAAALKYYRDNVDLYTRGSPIQYQTQGSLGYNDLEDSELGDIVTDPRYRENELAALRELEDISKQGFTASDLADMVRTENLANRAHQGRTESIRQGMQARGLGGSGLDIATQMQSAQMANEMEALKALEREGMMQDRKSNAALQLGNLSSQLQGRDYSQQAQKAQANDAINRFNAANRLNVNQWNQQNAQNIANQNVAQGNQWRDQQFQAKSGLGELDYNAATDDYNMQQAKKAEKQKKKAGMMGGLLGAAGAVAGGYFGSAAGPMGTAAGASAGYNAGSALGNAFGNMAQGGRVPGIPSLPYDTEANDTEPYMLTPSEIVVPASASDNPREAAAFAARHAGPRPSARIDDRYLNLLAERNPGLVQQYRARMDEGNREVRDAEDRQGYLELANVAAKGLTDFSNSQKDDLILANRLDSLGSSPKVMKAERNEYDGSDLSRLGAAGVQNARARRDEGIQQLLTGQQLAQSDLKSSRESAQYDPNSQESKLARETVMEIAPELAQRISGFSNMTAAQINGSLGGLLDKYRSDASIEAAKQARADARSDRNAIREETIRARQEVADDKAVENFSKTISGVQDTANAIGRVERILGAPLESFQINNGKLERDGEEVDLPGVNVPGLGRVSAYSGGARQLAGAVGTVFNTELKDRSGAAVTNNEMERLKNEFGAGLYNTEAELIGALQQYKTAMQQELKNREAGFNPRIKDIYEGRGGQTSGTLDQRTPAAPSAPRSGPKPVWAK